MRKMLVMWAVALVVLAVMPGIDWAAARSGGTFNFVLPYGGDVLTLDPHKTPNTNDWIVTINIHRSLYNWDDQHNRPKLELGEKVDISPDGLVYKIALKKGVKFHNGRQMTADDIIWSYERVMNAKTASPSARFVRVIKGAKEYEEGKAAKIAGLRKIDDFTLEITMDMPVDPAYTLYEGGTAILPKEEMEKKGDAFGTDPVGLGPPRHGVRFHPDQGCADRSGHAAPGGRLARLGEQARGRRLDLRHGRRRAGPRVVLRLARG